jgi:hypothetical protein
MSPARTSLRNLRLNSIAGTLAGRQLTRRTSCRRHGREQRLLRHPDRFVGFLERVVADLLVTDDPVRTMLDLAVLRGLLLDLLAAWSRARVQETYEMFSIAGRTLGQVRLHAAVGPRD